MAKVRMLTTKAGSPDGIQVLDYRAGQKYDLPERLAVIFLREGWAEEDKELAPPERKEAPPAAPPKDKMFRCRKKEIGR